eukprot:4125929-Pyramimonas_sp.AAC.1
MVLMVCEITYARVQGRQALLDHFRNSRFPCEEDEYLPLLFEPGQRKPKPLPVGLATGSITGTSPVPPEFPLSAAGIPTSPDALAAAQAAATAATAGRLKVVSP